MHQIERPISVKMLHEGDTFNIYVAQQALSTMTKHFPYRHDARKKTPDQRSTLECSEKEEAKCIA